MQDLKHFYIGVKSVIYNPRIQKALVLSKQDEDGNRYYDIPGGRIDSNEKIQDTLRRELQEEILNIGQNFKIEKLLSAYRLSHDLKDGLGLVLLFYKIEADIEEVQLSKEHDGYNWIGYTDLEGLRTDRNAQIEDGYFEALRSVLE